MLSAAQRNSVFVNIPTAYTIEGQDYTAIKEYKDRWDGEIDTPVIMLSYKSRTNPVAQSVGWAAEWSRDILIVDIFAQDDVTNGVHGFDIAQELARTLDLWFRKDANALIASSGVQVSAVSPAVELSFLEERVFRMQFEVSLLYRYI